MDSASYFRSNMSSSKKTYTAPSPPSLRPSLDARARSIFDAVVRTYLETGEPVGSRTISRGGFQLSAASIRNVMSDLTELGLLDSPHISAGRLPTQQGLRVFVDGLMEVGKFHLPVSDRRKIDRQMAKIRDGATAEDVMGEASELLSGLAGGAGLVSSPRRDAPVKQVDFISVGVDQALIVLVFDDGDLENRLLTLPPGLPTSTLEMARNYLTTRMAGRTLSEIRDLLEVELIEDRAELDAAASQLIAEGMAFWTGEDPLRGRSLIVRGRANLIEESQDEEDVERVRQLFTELDRKENLLKVLEEAKNADGVRLFIGEENPLFSLTGTATIMAPYMNAERKVIGALGVIGPTRLDYARVIPMVDYTAQIVGELLDTRPLASGKDSL